MPIGSDPSRGEEHIKSGTAAEVQNTLARAEVGEKRGVPAAEAGRRIYADRRELVRGISVAAARAIAAAVCVATARAFGHLERFGRVALPYGFLNVTHTDTSDA